jgi:hypothetical protein
MSKSYRDRHNAIIAPITRATKRKPVQSGSMGDLYSIRLE